MKAENLTSIHMLMKYILLLHKKYLNNLIFMYVNNSYILTFFTFLHFFYVEVNFHFKTLCKG